MNPDFIILCNNVMIIVMYFEKNLKIVTWKLNCSIRIYEDF